MIRRKKTIQDVYIHLISDATGETLRSLTKACIAQFDGIHAIERFWPLVRTEKQLARVFEDLDLHPGPVLCTLVQPDLRRLLQAKCETLNVPFMPVMDPLIKGLSSYLGVPSRDIPGRQHVLDAAYFKRMEAVDFALSFDDGQSLDGIEEADVILVGVSRTSKTPTCVYLARSGIRAANVPFVPEVPLPEKLLSLKGPLIVGLTESPERLAQLRATRLRNDHLGSLSHQNTYVDLGSIEEEVRHARRLFTKLGWPTIDVTRRSVEETAAEIMLLLQQREEGNQ